MCATTNATTKKRTWPRVEFDKTGCLFHWKVEPMLMGAPCLNFGYEFSQHVAETKADNYVRLLFGEPMPLQEFAL